MVRDHQTRRAFLKLGTLTASGLLLAGSAGTVAARRPNARFDLDFSSAADAADNTPTSAGWVRDRTAPEAWTATGGQLNIDIDETGDTTGFYAYQGKKYLDADGGYWYAGTGSRLAYRFYIDPDWESDDVGQQTGVWPVLGNANGAISAYPVLEYQDGDANDETGDAGFRAFVYETDDEGDFTSAEWVYLGLPRQLGIDPEEGGWVDVEVQLQQTSDGAAIKWRVNGRLVFDERGYNVFDASTQFLEFILNSRNFGEDQIYRYDDIVLTEPGTARR